AALAVWRISGEGKSAVAVLARSLPKTAPLVRQDALATLAGMGAAAGPAAGAVIELTDDPDYAVRNQAAATLARLGKTVLPALLEAMKSKEVRSRRNAVALFLGSLNFLAPEAATALRGRLEDKDLRVRADAARVLWLLGQTDRPVVAALLAGVRSTDA